MLKLRFRIWPFDDLLQLNPVLVEQQLQKVPGLAKFEVFDDRIGDGTSITVHIYLPELNQSAMTRLTQTMLDLPKMEVCLLDEGDEAFPLTEIQLADFEKFAQAVSGF